MRISAGVTGMEATGKKGNLREINRRFSDVDTEAVFCGNSIWTQTGSRLQENEETDSEDKEKEGQGGADRSEAVKIYEAAVSGKPNPITNLREAPSVPYGHLAKDGTIVYNGVCFVCDEKTNSICLGDMTDKENVLTIALSGGGHLKVNRDCFGLLSKAVGMFSAEDLNLIMRAISMDTRLQAVQNELEDEKADIGNELSRDETGADMVSRAAEMEGNGFDTDDRWKPDDLDKLLQ